MTIVPEYRLNPFTRASLRLTSFENLFDTVCPSVALHGLRKMENEILYAWILFNAQLCGSNEVRCGTKVGKEENAGKDPSENPYDADTEVWLRPQNLIEIQYPDF